MANLKVVLTVGENINNTAIELTTWSMLLLTVTWTQ